MGIGNFIQYYGLVGGVGDQRGVLVGFLVAVGQGVLVGLGVFVGRLVEVEVGVGDI